MKRLPALLIVFIVLMLTACATSGGGLAEPKDRTASLMEALAADPTGRGNSTEPSVVLPTPETVREMQVEEEAAEDEAPETAAAADAEEVQAEADLHEIAEAQPVAEELPEEEEIPAPEVTEEPEEPVVIHFEDEEPEIAEIPRPEAPSDEDLVPVAGIHEEAEPVIYPAQTVPSSQQNVSFMDEPMAPWMLRLMAILVVVMILFTASSAIRNAYRAPLSRIISAAIALLLTALSWVLSYIIAGPSLLYLVYLTLLFTYFVLRSSRRNSDSR